MGAYTSIEWTDSSWNPISGCTPISEGCEHCYAAAMARRFWKRPFSKVECHPDRLEAPLHWKKPRRIFVCSMSDLFHPDVPGEFRHQVFGIMAKCSQHTFQILTKRADEMAAWMFHQDVFWDPGEFGVEWPLPNVWIGVTSENQSQVEMRIPLLLQIQAPVRFVSVEPMLEQIHIEQYINHTCGLDDKPYPRLDWVICGGETGPSARPCKFEWISNLNDQCQYAKVPLFFKKGGSNFDGFPSGIDSLPKQFPVTQSNEKVTRNL